MKKIITIITIMAMMIMAMFAFAACGNKEEAVKEEASSEAQTEEVTESSENNTISGASYVLKERYTYWQEGEEFEKQELNPEEPTTIKFDENGVITRTVVYSGGERKETGAYEIRDNRIIISWDDSNYSTIPEEEVDAWKEYDKTIEYTIDGDSIIEEKKKAEIGSTGIPNMKNIYVKVKE